MSLDGNPSISTFSTTYAMGRIWSDIGAIWNRRRRELPFRPHVRTASKRATVRPLQMAALARWLTLGEGRHGRKHHRAPQHRRCPLFPLLVPRKRSDRSRPDQAIKRMSGLVRLSRKAGRQRGSERRFSALSPLRRAVATAPANAAAASPQTPAALPAHPRSDR